MLSVGEIAFRLFGVKVFSFTLDLQAEEYEEEPAGITGGSSHNFEREVSFGFYDDRDRGD